MSIISNGMLNVSGQHFVLDGVVDKLASTGVYIGLMTAYTGSETAQISAGITEFNGDGYYRRFSANWSKSGTTNPYVQGDTINFLPSSEWSSIKGYFVSDDLSGESALWYQPFPISNQGTFPSGVAFYIIPRYYQQYKGE